MRKPEWPGIATMIVALAIITIVIAIYREPEFKLKDWQPLMAACIALIGGALAYRGAMAKVELDRQTQLATIARQRRWYHFAHSNDNQNDPEQCKNYRPSSDTPSGHRATKKGEDIRDSRVDADQSGRSMGEY